MLDSTAWSGVIGTRGEPTGVLVLTTVGQRQAPNGSGSCAWQALAGEQRFWVKALNNPQGARVPLNEYVLSRAGGLIDAPVCSVSLVSIPADLAGEEIRDGYVLVEGIASGSEDKEGVVEERALLHRDEDENASRHAGVYAMHDWGWGGDDQWLYCSDEDNSIHSHDHGHYLPGGPNWTIAELEAHVDDEHLQPSPATGVDPDALDGYADRLEAVTRAQLASILKSVPAAWPVTDEELERLGWFLERRAPQVAVRLRALASIHRPAAGTRPGWLRSSWEV